MSDLWRQLQSAIYLAADTMHVWRDGAIAVLAGLIIACLWFYAEANQA